MLRGSSELKVNSTSASPAPPLTPLCSNEHYFAFVFASKQKPGGVSCTQTWELGSPINTSLLTVVKNETNIQLDQLQQLNISEFILHPLCINQIL